MAYENIGRLVDHWLSHPSFRDAVRKDVDAAIRQSGIDLSPVERELVNRVDWSMTDEDLQVRINKAL